MLKKSAAHPAWLLALLCACNFEAKCNSGSSLRLNTAEVEQSIMEEFARIDAELERAECPEKIMLSEHGTFECTVFFKDSGGLSLPVEVSQPKPGRLEFEHQTIVPSARAEKLVHDHLITTADHDTKVDCGVRVRLPAVGETFGCSFDYDGKTFPVQILFKDEDGNVSSDVQAVFSGEVEAKLPQILPPGGPNPSGMKVDCGPRLHPLTMGSTFPCSLHFSDESNWDAVVVIEPSETSPFSFRVAKVEPARPR